MEDHTAGLAQARALKETLRSQISSWLKANRNEQAAIAALGELTAQVALAFLGQMQTLKLMHELGRVILHEEYVEPTLRPKR